MKSRLGALAVAAALFGCVARRGAGGFAAVFENGKGFSSFYPVGEANWAVVGGNLEASRGGKTAAYLVSKESYGDFAIRVEFWASEDANSGVFLRCQDPRVVTDENCYEANIYDRRPDPTYGTGAITKVAPAPKPMPKAGGHWNTYEITAEGPHLVLVLNGQKTVDVRDSKFARGPFALQWVQGTIKFRKIEIKPL